MALQIVELEITWEKLPDDFILPDDPVDNINQPALAVALTDSLAVAGKLSPLSITPTNYGICATLNGKIVVKAPDWAFIPEIRVERSQVERSYTPELQGARPIIVMEFLCDTDGGEYSIKPTYPPGKWFFYERVLEVPYYGIFDPKTGKLELYRLDEQGFYQIQEPLDNGRYAIAPMELFLGVWEGTRENRNGYWLRWWNEAGELLLWGIELVAQERQRAEAESQRAEVESQRAETESQRAEVESQRADAERQRAERFMEQLRQAGIEPLDN
ncbi:MULTISPECIES: Uma2 family endonuclease [Arthrospira]|jgi:hypothetical protein|uniref:Putative restriction endonuclease domain-containing protein n=1 Tax=Limnospira platensis NIES-46 TaxID=1236695 RepID=A0A5M3T6R6_LIMPL|nr:Uma2 family endonuclease [Arthrospira platensis]AMW29215.1 hypothetical protein AP285_15825 [Arthrospira platensis YZ]KDR57203.1 hypothetical protein APPUASWS_012305 [Arthrospira platensis str. Paraca]MBD2709658.1 Uma2 family endonuclease [Arthrospira platensis FACHB-835]MDF2213089.1 Uma2 family endonuclease [Arthrospira platensis NCB002]MDT9295660.1 Uma2 family endonuclease [Arthrospira platensis PCC 7345]MDT9309851.1 Uma2 family endonuclease [Limnospira sp. Paracas R14]BAI91419.1 hypoth